MPDHRSRVGGPAAVPYRLVVPQGWTRLPVDPSELRVAVRAMLRRRFAAQPRDSTAALRREIEQQLLAVASGPGKEYLRMLLVLDLWVARRPVTATCLVSLLPQAVPGEQGLQDLAASMREGALESVVEDLGPNRGVVVVREACRPGHSPELDPAAATLARRYAHWMVTGGQAPQQRPASYEPLPADVLEAAGTTRAVDVFLPMPDASRLLLLSFSTSITALYEPLTTLFLTIASTVQWQRDDLWT